MTFIQTHWVQILAFLSTSWTVINAIGSRVSASLPAPTKDSTAKYIWWFQFVNNYLALNPERGKTLAAIENSPNFIPAAEKYMQDKLASGGGH